LFRKNENIITLLIPFDVVIKGKAEESAAKKKESRKCMDGLIGGIKKK